MQKRIALASAVAAVAVLTTPLLSFASPYASGITQSGDSVSFFLNENASDVTIFRESAVPITLGALTKGLQTFNLGGESHYYIQVKNTAAAGWTLTSTDDTLNNFEAPRGVAVNTNSALNGAPNPYFGRVYISNPRANSTVAGRTMTDGVWMHYADMSETNITGGTGPYLTGVGWATGTETASPFRMQVGADNSVYITDWSDSHSGLWQATPDLASASEILDSSDRTTSGLGTTHGSISDVVVSGTGANRVLYTTDEDYVAPGGTTGAILRYDIGANATFSGSPSAVAYDDAANNIINFEDSLIRDKNGHLWMSQNRSGGTDKPSLIEIDSTGAVVWNSLVQLGNPDPLRGIEGMAYDEAHDRFALVTTAQSSTRSGLIMIFDALTKQIIASFQFGGQNNTDVTFDAAGNLIVGNRSSEHVRVWSPGGDSVYSSAWDGSFSASEVPEPAALGALAVSGLALLGRRRKTRTA
jgi:hypothetical protein